MLRMAKTSREELIVLGLMVIGLIVRLWDINKHGLWFDETLTHWVATSNFMQIAGAMSLRDATPPLHQVFLHFWINQFGDSEISMRLVSVIFSVLTIPVTYRLGTELFNRRAGLVAALVVTLAHFHIFYSHEVRGYTMFGFLGSLATLMFIRVMREGKWSAQISYVFLIAACLYCHQYTVFVMGGHFIAVVVAKLQRQPIGVTMDRWFNLWGAACLLFVPWVPTVMRWFKVISRGFWVPDPYFSYYFDTWITYLGAPLIVLMVALLFFAVRRGTFRERSWQWALVLGIFGLTMLVPLIIAFTVRPMFAPRYGIVAAVALAIILGGLVASISSQVAQKLLTGLLCAVLVIFLFVPMRFDVLSFRADWRGAAKYVYENDPQAFVVLTTLYDDLSLRYYARAYEDRDMITTPKSFDPQTTSRDQFWLVNIDLRPPEDKMDLTGWKRVQDLRFDGIIVREYKRVR